jgi:hypothetical protein
MQKEIALTMTSLWTWFLRIIMGIVSFLVISLYQDIKALMSDINDLKVMVAETKKDIEYLKGDYVDFRSETKTRLVKLEDRK